MDLTAVNELKEYQEFTRTTNLYPPETGAKALAYGLMGETGEVCDVNKRSYRGDYSDPEQFCGALKIELGDCLWYLSEICSVYALKLEPYGAVEPISKDAGDLFLLLYKSAASVSGAILGPNGFHGAQGYLRLAAYSYMSVFAALLIEFEIELHDVLETNMNKLKLRQLRDTLRGKDRIE